jgi:cytoskeletal protein CcmA (bactofilin family)
MNLAFFNREVETLDVSGKSQMPEVASPGTFVPVVAATNGKTTSDTPATHAGVERRAYLDEGSKVSGKLNFEGSVHINGQIDGEINAKSSVIIGESAMVTAHIKAASIIVAGTVNGELIASERIEIQPSAKVSGKLTAPKLMVHEGAIFDGQCAMKSDEARQHRKTGAPAKEEPPMLLSSGEKQA